MMRKGFLLKDNISLSEFIKPYDSSIQKIAIALRTFVMGIVPEANELIWDNYNAVAIAYSKSEKLKDAFCHIALYSSHVNFGFNRGAEIQTKSIKLEGTGKLIRHIKVTNMDEFPGSEIQKMILEAVLISDTLNPELSNKISQGKSIVMSISKTK
jgi:hypothetical protein